MDGYDQLHPHSVEAERALLGGLIQRPDLLQEVVEAVGQDDFWRDDHRHLFALIQEMSTNEEPIDMVTLPERVLRHENPARYGGVAYVIELPEHAPSTANLKHYAQMIREKSTLRLLMKAGSELVSSASQHPENLDEVVNKLAAELVQLGTRVPGESRR